MITKCIIERWLDERIDNHSHMLVVIDHNINYSFHVFVERGQKVKYVIDSYREGWQDVHEVYCLDEDLADQVRKIRTWEV